MDKFVKLILPILTIVVLLYVLFFATHTSAPLPPTFQYAEDEPFIYKPWSEGFMKYMNSLRKEKGIKPLAAATSKQMSCASKIAIQGQKNFAATRDAALNPKIYGNCSEQAMFIMQQMVNITWEDLLSKEGRLKVVLDPKFKSVASAITDRGFFRINFYT